jgi:hypothetical protein
MGDVGEPFCADRAAVFAKTSGSRGLIAGLIERSNAFRPQAALRGAGSCSQPSRARAAPAAFFWASSARLSAMFW